MRPCPCPPYLHSRACALVPVRRRWAPPHSSLWQSRCLCAPAVPRREPPSTLWIRRGGAGHHCPPASWCLHGPSLWPPATQSPSLTTPSGPRSPQRPGAGMSRPHVEGISGLAHKQGRGSHEKLFFRLCSSQTYSLSGFSMAPWEKLFPFYRLVRKCSQLL